MPVRWGCSCSYVCGLLPLYCHNQTQSDRCSELTVINHAALKYSLLTCFVPVFLFAILLSSAVAPPDNVTIVCQNGTNIAYWNYTGDSAVEFSVMVNSYRWVNCFTFIH